MTSKFLDTLNGKKFDTPPVWLMRQAGRYLPEYLATRSKAGSFLDLCYNPDFATEVTLQPIRRFGFDAAILFSDILVVPHALGQELTFAQNHGPKLGPLPPLEHVDLQKFHVNLLPVYDAVKSIRSTLDHEGFSSTPLIGFSGAPWTLACYMIEGEGSKDFGKTRAYALKNPEEFGHLISLLTECITAYLLRQIESGAAVIQLFDSWAGCLPPDQFRKWVIAPTKKIREGLRAKYPAVPFIGFPRGASFLYEDYCREVGVSAIGLDTQVPPEYAAKNLQPLCAVQGNLDPFTLVAGGDELLRQCDLICDRFAGGPHIFNLGHGIDKETPPHHVELLLNRIRSR